MPKISVIVPVYNAEPYIRECLDSLIAQTFADFEAILVDDASPDGCPQICDEYAAKDSRFKTVHHPENRGVSAARNTGLDHATSQYIAFADSDDYCYPDYLETMLKLMETHKPDLVITEYYNEKAFIQKRETDTIAIFGNLEVFLCKKCDVGTPYCRLYIHSIIKERGIRFDETVFIYEDKLFVTEYLQYARKVVYSDKKTYHYRYLVAGKNTLTSFLSQETANNKLVAIYEKIVPTQVYCILETLTNVYLKVVFYYWENRQKPEAREYLRKAHHMVQRLLRDDHAPVSVKLKALLKVYCYRLFGVYTRVARVKLLQAKRAQKQPCAKDRGMKCPK
jgi:glycosyltransferase involved in cell wall biosynthesis